MDAPGDERGGPQSRVQAQLSVRHGRAAVEFYQRAFGAVERYRVGGTDADEADVDQLAVGGPWFWGADGSPEPANSNPESLGGGSVRMLLIAADPAALVAQAVAAGAREVTPVADQHGWGLGRVGDPFGHHWEIGRPLGGWPPDHG